MKENVIQEALARTLESQGYVVHREVSCRDLHYRSDKERLRLDLLAIPSLDMRHVEDKNRRRAPFTCIGIETKGFNLGTGKSLVEPTFQVEAYMRAFAYLDRNGNLLPRPQIVLVANPVALEIQDENDLADPNRMTDSHNNARLEIAERYLWKSGGAYICRTAQNLVFHSNAAVPATAWHYLARRDAALDEILDNAPTAGVTGW